jgi:hypothetical protein
VVSDNSDNEILDRDSEVHTTSLCKQLRSSAVGFASDIETNSEEQENSEPESSDCKTSDVCCITNQKPITKSFIGATVLNIITDNSEFVLQVVRSIDFDEQLRTSTFCTR